jgi:hypothetical protein
MNDVQTARALKRITREGVATALQKAHRYRVLNDSAAAESICLDVLAVEPGNVEALVMHVLAITDQFAAGHTEDLKRAEAAVAQLKDPYKQAYYRGIVCERWAKSILARNVPRGAEMAWEWVDRAFSAYGEAESLRAAGNDEAILRWNACVRLLAAHPHVRPGGKEAWEPALE